MQSKENELSQFSNVETVRKKARLYKYPHILISTRKEKKYMVKTPQGRTVHFGQMGYEDFTKHKDKKRRKNYLTRTANIKGAWREDPFSANNLARNLLW
jgi:hypothetical protein